MEPVPTLLYIGRTSATDVKSLLQVLGKLGDVVTATSGKAGQAQCEVHTPQVIVVDAASLRTHGDRVCKLLRSAAPQASIIRIVTAEAYAVPNPCADVSMRAPVTPRRLSNQIRKLLNQPKDRIVEAGPFTLNITRRILSAQNTEVQLNPKLAALAELLLKHPDQTLDRQTMMKTVWQTDFMGDTRTLSVHVSQFRNLLKANGLDHALFETVRGVGYRFNTVTIDPSA
jgi:DNA-binding response OmpR family regulator